VQYSAALRFFFVKVLRRPYREIDLVYPKRPERLPVILSEEEVARLIESACNAYHRVILMTLYGTGLRREELCRLKLTDVDSQRMVIHVRHKHKALLNKTIVLLKIRFEHGRPTMGLVIGGTACLRSLGLSIVKCIQQLKRHPLRLCFSYVL
jgi:integrase